MKIRQGLKMSIVLSISLFTHSALAEEKAAEGIGTINFNDDLSLVAPIDPEDPAKFVAVEPIEGVEQEEQGSLSVNYISNFKFDVQKIKPFTEEANYYASPTMVNKNGMNTQRGNYIQVTDRRTGGTKKGWTLNAKMTKPFTTAEGAVLTAAKITLLNPFVNSVQSDVENVIATENVELTLNNEAKIVQAEAGNGWGTYTFEYGKTTDNKMDKSVKLSVPAATRIYEEKYMAEITWTIANVD